METYRTLSFKSERQAKESQIDIASYFASRLIDSIILKGVDERGNYGFYVSYNLLK